MAPRNNNKLNQAIAAYTYVKNEATTPPSPLKPAEPVLMPRYFKHLVKWSPRQNRNYVDLVTRGISLTKDGVIVSTLKQATDYVQGTLPTGTWEAPSPLLYVRPADIQRGYDATTPKITDFTAFTLPSSIKILPDHLSSLSRELFADIVSTMPDRRRRPD